MSDPTVASVFLKVLKKHGIRHIFGLPTIQIGMMQDGFGCRGERRRWTSCPAPFAAHWPRLR